MLLNQPSKCIVLTQIHVVHSIARRNGMYEGLVPESTIYQPETGYEHLSKGLMKLRRLIQQASHSQTEISSPRELVLPFVRIIRAENTSGPTTGAALTALYTFLTQPECRDCCFDPKNPYTVEALTEIVEGVTQCRFQATDPEDDQLVVLSIIRVLSSVLRSIWREMLSDDTMWKIFETCYTMACIHPTQVHFSTLLNTIASNTLDEIIQFVFQYHPQKSNGSGLPCAVKIVAFLCEKVPVPNTNEDADQLRNDESESILALSLLLGSLSTGKALFLADSTLLGSIQAELSFCLLRHARVTDFTSIECLVLSLQIIRQLWAYYRQDFKMQFDAIMNGVFIHALHWCLLFVERKTLSPDLTNQQIRTAKAASEVLECLVDLLAEATTVTDLYLNYDCDEQYASIICEVFELLRTISSSACALHDDRAIDESYTEWSQVELELAYHMGITAQNGLFNALQVFYHRSRDGSVRGSKATKVATDFPKLERAEVVLQRRERKVLMTEGCELFNKKPKSGLQFLQQYNILPTPLSTDSVVELFRSLPAGLDKVAIGSFLGSIGKEPSEQCYEGDTVAFHETTLKSYVESFNFENIMLLDSLRMFLSSFRLPGEAQQIDRILNAFAHVVFEHCQEKSIFATPDVAYLLSFSIIMLNTDLHNPNIRPEKKMKLADFHRTNLNYGQDVSQGKDLPLEYLSGIYESIFENQFRTVDEVGADAEITEDRWKDLLMQIRSNPKSKQFLTTQATSVTDAAETHSATMLLGVECDDRYDEQIFQFLSKYFTSTFATIFDTFADAHNTSEKRLEEIQTACNGFMLTASLASSFKHHEEFNRIIFDLGQRSTLVNSPVTDIKEKLSLFALNGPARLATSTVLQLVQSCADSFASAWVIVLAILISFREFRSLPQALLDSRDYLTLEERRLFQQAVREISNERKALETSKLLSSRSTASIFDTFTSFFSISAENPATEVSAVAGTSSIRDSVDLSVDIGDLIGDLAAVTYEGKTSIEEKEDDAKQLQDELEGNYDENGPRYLTEKQQRQQYREYLVSYFESYHLENFLESTKNLIDESLWKLCTCLIEKVEGVLLPPPPSSAASSRIHSETPGGAIFCSHLLIEVALMNSDRMFNNWHILHEHYQTLFLRLHLLITGNLKVNGMEYDTAAFLLNQTIAGLFHLIIRSTRSKKDFEASTPNVYDSIHLVLGLNEAMLTPILPQILAALCELIDEIVGPDPDDWSSLHDQDWSYICKFLELGLSTPNSFVPSDLHSRKYGCKVLTKLRTVLLNEKYEVPGSVVDKLIFLSRKFIKSIPAYGGFDVNLEEERYEKNLLMDMIEVIDCLCRQTQALTKDIEFAHLLGLLFACCQINDEFLYEKAWLSLQDIILHDNIIVKLSEVPWQSLFLRGVAQTILSVTELTLPEQVRIESDEIALLQTAWDADSPPATSQMWSDEEITNNLTFVIEIVGTIFQQFVRRNSEQADTNTFLRTCWENVINLLCLVHQDPKYGVQESVTNCIARTVQTLREIPSGTPTSVAQMWQNRLSPYPAFATIWEENIVSRTS